MISSSNGTSSLKTLLGACINLPIKETDLCLFLCYLCMRERERLHLKHVCVEVTFINFDNPMKC